jgi:hypothetical protein
VRRDKCGNCGSGSLEQFLDLGSTPLADDFPDKPDSVNPLERWPLGAVECGNCCLIQLSEVVPDEILWGGDYGFYTGASPSSIRYFDEYARQVAAAVYLKTQVDSAAPLVVEIASNDGTFLSALERQAAELNVNCRMLGVEPARGPAKMAMDAGHNVIRMPFGRTVAQKIVDTNGYASVVVASNVIAHVADLADFVGGIATLLADNGLAFVEFQYAGDLLCGNGIDLFYHEHRSFFSLRTMENTLRRNGLRILDAMWTSAQGGSQRVTVGHVVEGAPVCQAVVDEPQTIGWQLEGMQLRADMIRERLRRTVYGELSAGRQVVAYGAPAKATTLLNWCELTGSQTISVAYDATPTKAGRYIPGTDIPITFSPSLHTASLGHPDGVSALVLPHNYLPGILKREAGFMAAGGRLIVPLPVPVVL